MMSADYAVLNQVFKMVVKWSNGSTSVIYRRYSMFFDFLVSGVDQDQLGWSIYWQSYLLIYNDIWCYLELTYSSSDSAMYLHC